MSFTLRFALVLIAGVAAAMALSPLAAIAVDAAGYRFPFPRIFDRTVMATLLIAILWNGRKFKARERLARGFANPSQNMRGALRGLIVAMTALAALAILAIALEGRASVDARGVLFGFPGHLVAAIAIAIIEEGFFRAFILDGMETDFGKSGAVVASSVVYALAHLLRSPARFHVERLDATAGARSLAGALANVTDPRSIAPMIGLFLIGLILGEGFVLTGTVYFSIGMHAGLILGLRSWRAIVADRVALAGWLFGYGRFPLVSGVGGWLIAAAILALIRRLARAAGRRDGGGAEADRRSAASRAGAS